MLSREIKNLAAAGNFAGLRRIYEQSGSKPRARRRIVERLGLNFSPESTQLLAEVAKTDSDESIRGIAARWLVDPRRDALEDHLADFSSEDSMMVLSAFARGLAKNPSDASVETLAGLVSQADRGVRWPALKSLERIGGPRVASAAAPALSDSEQVVRILAAAIIADSGDPDACDLLETQIKIESGLAKSSMERSLKVARKNLAETTDGHVS